MAAVQKLPATLPRAGLATHPFDLDFTFDELQLFPGTAALASGKAGIAFNKAGAWKVDWIELNPDYRGGAMQPIEAGLPLYRAIRDALQISEAQEIAQKVEAALVLAGYWIEADPNDEHRLGAAALGVGRAA